MAGGNLTLTTLPDGTPEADSFCVSGNTLVLQNVGATGGISPLMLTR